MPSVSSLRWPPPESLVFQCPCCGYRLATTVAAESDLWQVHPDNLPDPYAPVELEHRIVRCDLCYEEFGLRISRTGRAYGELPARDGSPARGFSYLAADLDRGLWLTGQLYRKSSRESGHPWVDQDPLGDQR